MKKILCFILIGLIFATILLGCSQKIPDGIENEKFYSDMISVLPMLKENLIQQDILGEDLEIMKIIVKYIKIDIKVESSDHVNGRLNITRFIKEGLNEKEKEILKIGYDMIIEYNNYIDYQKRNSVKILKDQLIDDDNLYALFLKRYINDFVKNLEVNYEIE